MENEHGNQGGYEEAIPSSGYGPQSQNYSQNYEIGGIQGYGQPEYDINQQDQYAGGMPWSGQESQEMGYYPDVGQPMYGQNQAYRQPQMSPGAGYPVPPVQNYYGHQPDPRMQQPVYGQPGPMYPPQHMPPPHMAPRGPQGHYPPGNYY